MKRIILLASIASASSTAAAHSASDAYLTLSLDRGVIHGQWDIALRDLEFVLHLDSDGDGKVTWGELKRQQAAIERYAYPKLTFSGGPDNVCSTRATRQLVDAHADGAYAVLMFDLVCARPTTLLAVNYNLFFAVDPSHRGIFVMHAGDNTSTAVLSPENAKLQLPISQ